MRLEHIPRIWVVSCICLIVIIFCGSARSLTAPVSAIAQPNTPFALPDASESWDKRFLHTYRTTLQLPSSWHLFDTNDIFYDSSWVHGLVLRLASADMEAQPLQEACQEAATRFFHDFTVEYLPLAGGQACVIESSEREWSQAVIRRPFPYTPLTRGPVNTLWWFAHRDVMHRILETVSFEPPSTALYLEEALRILEENFIFTDEVDWNAVRARALATLDADSTYAQAHDALTMVFENDLAPLDNGHSGFLPPADSIADNEDQSTDIGCRSLVVGPTEERLIILVYAGGPADRAGLRAGDVLTLVNGQTFADYFREFETHPERPLEDTFIYHVRRPGQPDLFKVQLTVEEHDIALPVTGRRLDGDIAYIETFPVGLLPDEADAAYATEAQAVIAALDSPAACGWIVDVRRNWGGSEVPMALAVAPLWDEGVFLRLRDPRGLIHAHRCEDGMIIDPADSRVSDTRVVQPYRIQHGDAPVAVLMSNLTGSMGEVTVRMLINRHAGETRTFGERTSGMDSTLLRYTFLMDNARLNYSWAVVLDPAGKMIREPIEPDVPMVTDYSLYGTDDDPLVEAARNWLLSQPECSTAS